jgi:hypothetical protein
MSLNLWIQNSWQESHYLGGDLVECGLGCVIPLTSPLRLRWVEAPLYAALPASNHTRHPSPLLLVHCGCSMEGWHSTRKYCSAVFMVLSALLCAFLLPRGRLGRYCSEGVHNPSRSSSLLGAPSLAKSWGGRYYNGGCGFPASFPILRAHSRHILWVAVITAMVVAVPAHLRFSMLPPSRFWRWQVFQRC